MADLINFYNDVFPYIPDCPENVAKHAIRRAVAKFCTDTLVYHEKTTAAYTSGNDYQIVVTPTITNVNIVAVFYVNGIDSASASTPIYPATSSQDTMLQSNNGIGRTRYEFVHPDIIRLVVTPDTLPVSLELKVAYSLNNLTSYTTVPNELYDRYSDVIADGALGRLMRMPKKPYTDLQLAREHTKMFQRGITLARSRVMRMGTHSPLMTSLPPNISMHQQAVYQ